MPQIAIETTAASSAMIAIRDDLDTLIDRKIRSFLAANSYGSELLEALYGDTIDEAVPARLTTLLRP